MSKLIWKPQPAFADFFYTDTKDIIKNRSVFRKEIVHFVPYGGRGSGKTFSFADAVVVEASIRPVRILVTRELQNSIEESIKAEIEAAIEKRGLGHFFEILKTEINGLNGSKFIFKGLKNNINNLKSISAVDIVLCEESENISAVSWTKLLPSIRPQNSDNRDGEPIIIVIFNPDDELDDTYERFVENPPSKTVSKLINWRDNKYFTANLERQRQDSLRLRPPAEHDNVWEGKPKGANANAIIDLEWIKAAKFASQLPDWPESTEGITASYDPAGQGRDFHAVSVKDGNTVIHVEEWLLSDDLRVATKKALRIAIDKGADCFRYDKCGGFGDGVAVFVSDEIKRLKVIDPQFKLKVQPFDAGSPVVQPKRKMPGTTKTWGDQYVNAKAQAHAITAQLLYTTFRFVRLGDRDMSGDELMSINVDDVDLFRKLSKEMKAPLWVKSARNSKKMVEDKTAMEKRTGQASPNISDSVHMCNALIESGKVAMLW